jgi:uncharacterized membrane protein YkgB
MFLAYVVITVLAAAANIYAATNDFRHLDWVLANMQKLGIEAKNLNTLGILKTAGGLGLLAGFANPMIGIAAGIGLVVFFIGAVIVTVQARWYSHLPYPLVWLALAAGSLLLRITTH